MEEFFKGMQAAGRKEKPTFTDPEFAKALAELEEMILQYQVKTNLRDAEAFLMQLQQEKDLIEIVPQKVYGRILKQGIGQPIEVKPVLSFELSVIDSNFNMEKLFSSSETGAPEQIDLDETIKGFQLGVRGMQRGEKRVLYIHPDFGFGETGNQIIPPNKLLSFSIEAL